MHTVAAGEDRQSNKAAFSHKSSTNIKQLKLVQATGHAAKGSIKTSNMRTIREASLSILAWSTQPVLGTPAKSLYSAASGSSVRDRQRGQRWLPLHSLSVSASPLNAVISHRSDRATGLLGSHVHGTGTGLGPMQLSDSQRGSPSGACHTYLCARPLSQPGICTCSKLKLVAAPSPAPELSPN